MKTTKAKLQSTPVPALKDGFSRALVEERGNAVRSVDEQRAALAVDREREEDLRRCASYAPTEPFLKRGG